MKLGFKTALVGIALSLLVRANTIAASRTNSATAIQRQVQQVMADSQKSMQSFKEGFRSNDEAVRNEALKKYQAIRKQSVDKLFELSKKDPKDPGTVDALVMILFSGHGTDGAKEALDILKRGHLMSSNITGLCVYLEDNESPEAKPVLEKIAKSNPNPVARAAAMIGLGKEAKESDPEKAENYFERVSKEFPHSKYEIFGHKMDFAEEAKKELFELQHLGIGKPAPDITGEDGDGKKFSLSEYRGKVVMIDFWGDW
jgi:hypothetical protein